jgi:hypothetical protein
MGTFLTILNYYLNIAAFAYYDLKPPVFKRAFRNFDSNHSGAMPASQNYSNYPLNTGFSASRYDKRCKIQVLFLGFVRAFETAEVSSPGW